jgi:uncharacterized protein YggE
MLGLGYSFPMRASTRIAILTIVAVLWAPWTESSAQAPDARMMPPSVTVTGEAAVVAEPDLAEIDIGVTSQSRTAVEAAKENAGKLSKVVAEIRKRLAPGDELKTAGYSLSPNYRYPREGGKPEILGYTATNIVRVKTQSLGSVGKLIDAATRSGANNIHRLGFTLRDEQAAQGRALRDAAVRARSKADEIARALGLKIVRVLSIAETDRSVRPLFQEAMAARAEMPAPQTPVEPGSIEVRSMVTLTAELGN